MPDVYTRFDLPAVRDELSKRLARGEVGILPTDTLYGLSGDATNAAVVRRIHRIKKRRTPLSVVAPSLEWARTVVAARVPLERLAQKYAGAFTVLCRAAPRLTLPAAAGSRLVGLRFCEHWVSELAAEVGRPLVSTSVNRTRGAPMTSLETLDAGIAREVDFIVYEGEKPGPASTLVWLRGPKPVLERRA